MSNPFAGFGRIVTGDRLVGRRPLVERITHRLTDGSGSLAIVGEPRIGKSSVAAEAARAIGASADAPLVAWITVSSLPDSTELFRSVVDELTFQAVGRATPPAMPESHDGGVSSYESFRRCRLALQQFRAQGLSSIVVFDEFDAVRSLVDPEPTIKRLRELVYQPHRTGLSALFVTRRSLLAIETQIDNVSTLDGVCEQVFLGPLDETGLRDMVARGGDRLELSESDFDSLMAHTGGHPFLAEMVLSRTWELGSLGAGLDVSLGDIFDLYCRLEQLLAEDALFDDLLQLTVGPTVSVAPGSLERLLRYGILVERDEESAYRGWSAHFQSFLELRWREGSTWALWGKTEQALRSLIANVLSDAFGPEWMKEIGAQSAALREIVVGCESRRDKEERNFGVQASRRLLDYAYPMDLWMILSRNWPLFKDRLGRDKNFWNERFSLLSKVRTPSAHNREANIPEHDVSLARAYCKEILSRLTSEPAPPASDTA